MPRVAKGLRAEQNLFASHVTRPLSWSHTSYQYRCAFDRHESSSCVKQADKVKRPILLVHGEDDNNTGTFPMQVTCPL